jgi:hypothetical protein
MDKIIETLQNKKAKIESNKSKRDKLQGRLDQSLVTLDEKFGCKTLAKADEKYEEQKGQLDQQKDDICSTFENLKEKYDW